MKDEMEATLQTEPPVKTPGEIERANDLVLSHPFHRFAGLTLVSQAPGKAVTRFAAAGDLLNVNDALQPGVLYGLIDATSFLALITVLKPAEYAATHNLHVSVLHAVPRGYEVEMQAEVIRRSTDVAFIKCDVWRVCARDRRLAATATVTKSLSFSRAG